MRITKKSLAQLLNKVLMELHPSFHLTPNDIEPTRYRPDQYAEGASKLRILAKDTEATESAPLAIYSSYTMHELTQLLQGSSKKIVLRKKDFTHLDDLWIELE